MVVETVWAEAFEDSVGEIGMSLLFSCEFCFSGCSESIRGIAVVSFWSKGILSHVNSKLLIGVSSSGP